ncbi:globin [Henriciella aquimarina]|uniref:globin n=1 Tax=Henriciella aquimarina TaxID=545261 RepID=UPI0018EF8C34|nr:globin [Henriciella aquimarina]
MSNMAETGLIIETLERAGTLCPDPGPRIYKRLFELRPEFADLFVMDAGGEVRATMLETSLTCLIGIAEGDETQAMQLAANRSHHEGYGIAEDEFDIMFTAMRDVFRDLLGVAWTEAHEEAWHALLGEAAEVRHS